MQKLQKGTWIINSIKHLSMIRTNAPELAYFEATEQSGKAGLLLARLVADNQEIVAGPKVKVFARESGITALELIPSLNHLKAQGKVDFRADSGGNVTDVEVDCFSAQDAIESTAELYDRISPSEHEDVSLVSLDDTFHLPRYRSELSERLGKAGFKDGVVKSTLDMQESLQLIRTSEEAADPLFYNEYAFAGEPAKIARAIKSLPDDQRDTLEEVQNTIEAAPGYLLETLETKYPSNILRLMEGVGLVDAVTGNVQLLAKRHS